MRILGAHPRCGAHLRCGTAILAVALAATLTGVPAAVADDGSPGHAAQPENRGEHNAAKRRASAKSVRARVPVVAFVGIADGQPVGRRATFRVRLANFTICPSATPSRLVPGQGFLHFSMDGGALDLPGYSANAAWAVRAGTQGRYSPSQSSSLTYGNMPRGTHQLRVTLSDNFQAETGVTATVTFVVR